MNNFYKIVRKIVIGIAITTIIICIGFIIMGVIYFFGDYARIEKQQAITGIIIPMICAIIGACIPIVLDNSLLNKKLKISLNRLERWWKYHCLDQNKKLKIGYKSLDFDAEYKFIVENRGKSHKRILNSMSFNDYWDIKYLSYKKQICNNGNIRMMTKKEFLEDWIKDHFIY